MATQEKLFAILEALPNVSQSPHFNKLSFRIGKKIFVTFDTATSLACFRFPAIEQSIYTAIDKGIIYAVPNKWGKQGWTFVDIHALQDEGLLKEMVDCAYGHLAGTKGMHNLNRNSAEKD